MNRRHLHVACVALLALMCARPQPALAYLKFGVPANGRQVTLKWAQTPVRYFISTQSAAAGVSASEFQAAVACWARRR